MTNFTPSNSYWPETHVVENLPMPLEDFNVYTSDEALVQVVAKLSGSTNDGLQEFGRLCGEAATIDLGFQANHQKPELHTHDRYGNRVDEVRFHPAYHELMRLSSRNGLHCEHWENCERRERRKHWEHWERRGRWEHWEHCEHYEHSEH